MCVRSLQRAQRACQPAVALRLTVIAAGELHFGTFPRKLAGQANSALHTAHTRRGIVPRSAGDRCWLALAALAIAVSVASRPQVQGLYRAVNATTARS